MPLLVVAQNISGGFLSEYSANISYRWSYNVALHTNYLHSDANFICSGLKLKANFAITDSVIANVSCKYTYGKCLGADNTDIQIKISEGICFNVNYGLSHSLAFDQLILHYQPSNYENTCTRFLYTFGKVFPKFGGDRQNSFWQIKSNVAIVTNIRADVSDTPFLQRVKLQNTIVKHFESGRELGLEYTFMLGGKKQIYLDDAHCLNRLFLFFKFGK